MRSGPSGPSVRGAWEAEISLSPKQSSKTVFISDLGIAVNNLNPRQGRGREAELPANLLPPPTLQLTTLCAETQAKQGADRK